MAEKISAVIVTLDEEHDIGECIESVSWYDEVLVVDSGSKDRTVEIAISMGARVIHRPFEGFARQKQFAVDSAEHDWILSIDADERATRELSSCIQNLDLNADVTAGYIVNRREFFQGRELKHGRSGPLGFIRFFNRRKGRFSQPAVHETVEIHGAPGKCHGDLIHNSYRTLTEHFSKFNLYTSLYAAESYERGDRTVPWRVIASFPKTLIDVLIVRLGVLDGYRGILLGVFHALYVMVRQAKLYEIQRESCQMTDR